MSDLVSDRAFQALTQNGCNLRQSAEMASRIVVAEYIHTRMIPSTQDLPIQTWLRLFIDHLESRVI